MQVEPRRNVGPEKSQVKVQTPPLLIAVEVLPLWANLLEGPFSLETQTRNRRAEIAGGQAALDLTHFQSSGPPPVKSQEVEKQATLAPLAVRGVTVSKKGTQTQVGRVDLQPSKF